jgi:bis(5'-nucleosyl)-tetraphosphatase (symmetrical)
MVSVLAQCSVDPDVLCCVWDSGKSALAMKAILIGDVHGCLSELECLLSTLEAAGHVNYKHTANDPKNKLIYLGDFLDRGSDSVGVVRLVKQQCEEDKALAVCGNHDEKHVRWRRHTIQQSLTGKTNPMKPMSPHDLDTHKQLTDEEIAWIRSLPLTLHIHSNWFALHAGLESRFDFDHQDPNQLLRCRYLNADGKAVALNPDKSQPEGSVFWTEAWNGSQSVVYGHCVHSLTTPRIDDRPNGVRCIGIDTGCCFGGSLTAAILDWKNDDKDPTISFVQVQATRDYVRLSTQYEE